MRYYNDKSKCYRIQKAFKKNMYRLSIYNKGQLVKRLYVPRGTIQKLINGVILCYRQSNNLLPLSCNRVVSRVFTIIGHKLPIKSIKNKFDNTITIVYSMFKLKHPTLGSLLEVNNKIKSYNS